MRCSYKPQANSLWSMVYCLLTLLMTSYLFYLGARRYFTFNEHDWPTRSHSNIYTFISVALNGFALVLVPFFIIACCFKVGNLASDGERMGERTKKVVDVLVGTPICRKLKSAWQHGPPVAQTLHLIIAFALLMAHTLLETQFFKYHYGSSILETEEIWSTDLELLYNVQDDKLTQLIRGGDKGRTEDPHSDLVRRHEHHQRYPRIYRSSEYDGVDQSRVSELFDDVDHRIPAASSVDISPRLLPLLSSFRLYGVSFLFFNYVVALFIYACVYPSVYWRANKPFSVVFCCHLILHAITSVFAFVGFVVLYRFQVSGVSRPPFILNEYLLIIVYVASCAVLFLSSAVVYGYGYNKFCIRLLLTATSGRGRLSRRGTKTHPICCEGYCPHIAAILMLVLMVAAKAPVLYDQMILYQKYLKSITMVCIVVDVVYLFAWILLWLALTLKRDWAFKVRYTNADIGALLGMLTDEGRAVNDSTLMVISGDDYFATDDESKRTAILQLAEKCGLGQHDEEVYWLKPSHGTSGAGNVDRKQNMSPEMNTLLSGSSNLPSGASQRAAYQPSRNHHHNQIPHGKAATIGVSGGNYYRNFSGGAATNTATLGYEKVNFNDAEPGTGTTPYLQKRQQEQRFAQTRASGSYVRFCDDQSALALNNYDDHAAQDIVSTFGTLPRQDFPRRRMIHDNGEDIFLPPSKQQKSQVQTLASIGALKRTPSPMCPPQSEARTQPEGGDVSTPGFVTYASVHKRSASPGFRSATEYGRILQQPQPQQAAIASSIGDTQTDAENMSRVSSYANIPNSSKQQCWDAASLTKLDAARPPTGRSAVPPTGMSHQQPQQYHHHQHHYNNPGSADSSPPFYGTLPQTTSVGTGTPNVGQSRRHHVTLQSKASPKHSPNLDLDCYNGGVNGQPRKMTSFSNSSSASGGGGAGGESSDTTPTQQNYVLLGAGTGAPTTATLAASASSSSREMTPLSNASGSLNRPAGGTKRAGVTLHQQSMAPGNWPSNSIYNPVTTASGRCQTSNYGIIAPNVSSTSGLANANHIHQQHGNVGMTYYDGGHRVIAPGSRPPLPAPPTSGVGQSTTSAGGRTLLGLESHDRNDSANFSLTSSNESDNNQFVTSIV